MKIAIIGFGKIGAAIAARLIECGHEVVEWSRDIQKVEISKIVDGASTPQQVTQKSDVIISTPANDEATECAYFGGDGILLYLLGLGIIYLYLLVDQEKQK